MINVIVQSLFNWTLKCTYFDLLPENLACISAEPKRWHNLPAILSDYNLKWMWATFDETARSHFDIEQIQLQVISSHEELLWDVWMSKTVRKFLWGFDLNKTCIMFANCLNSPCLYYIYSTQNAADWAIDLKNCHRLELLRMDMGPNHITGVHTAIENIF